MRKVEVKIMSKDTIKPSAPTPPQTFHLSLLDQLIPAPYAPLTLFYQKNDTVSSSSAVHVLKSSLSDTLTRFYPLAGTISHDDLSIDCNDKGASFVHARTTSSMTRFLARPDILSLHKFLPVDPASTHPDRHVSNLQLTEFSCGGVAVAVCISHKILDGAALGCFLKAWTAAARQDGTIIPNFLAGTLFPARDDSSWLRDSSMPMWGSFFKTGQCITRRIVFDSTSIQSLKAKARLMSTGSPPTRVEIVSALLWKSIMAASEKLTGQGKTSVLTHLVNLRKRVEPPMSENSVGNLLWMSSAKSDHPGRCAEREVGELAGRVRESISKIDDAFVKRMRGVDGKLAMAETFDGIVEMKRGMGADFVGFSSWCKLGFYGSDFGWGEPVWVSSYGLEGSVFMNLVILSDTRSGKGIEAWVTLDQQQMAAVAADPEMIKFAKFDPTPLY